MGLILKRNFCFDVNGRFESTWGVTLYDRQCYACARSSPPRRSSRAAPRGRPRRRCPRPSCRRSPALFGLRRDLNMETNLVELRRWQLHVNLVKWTIICEIGYRVDRSRNEQGKWDNRWCCLCGRSGYRVGFLWDKWLTYKRSLIWCSSMIILYFWNKKTGWHITFFSRNCWFQSRSCDSV